MSGKKANWLPLFLEFIERLQIDSKENDDGKLVPYGAQLRFLETLARGLEDDIRFFVFLKARQLGISTIGIAVDLFWMLMHDRLQGALIADTAENKDKFRHIMTRFLENLPKKYKMGVRVNNRQMLALENGSTLDYLAAGVRRGGNLGRSKAYNYIHATECAFWGDPKAVDSLLKTMAQTHPNRLYTFESTANGFNHFQKMWVNAQEDNHVKRAVFLGWWSKPEVYTIPKSDPRYAELMIDPPTDEEREKAELVSEAYEYQIKPEQLAWYRNEEKTEMSEGMIAQEFPWHEHEAFISTGSHFFPAKRLAEDLKAVLGSGQVKFKAYRYVLSDTFTGTRTDLMDLNQVQYASHAHLRMWEPPKLGAEYCIGVDPAYGRNDHQDNHCISVWRSYGDRIVQVAEWASPDCETYHLTWVLAHLAAIYRDCQINIEVQGPGTAVMQGLKQLKQQLRAMAPQTGEPEVPKDFMNALESARWYLYHRPDSVGQSGFAYGWISNQMNKMTILNQMRDSFVLKQMVIRSGPLLTEMEGIRQEGSDIGAPEHDHDDRVFAAALAHKAWYERQRNNLLQRGHTWAKCKEAEEKGISPDIGDSFVGGIVKHTFAQIRTAEKERLRQAAWKGVR